MHWLCQTATVILDYKGYAMSHQILVDAHNVNTCAERTLGVREACCSNS